MNSYEKYSKVVMTLTMLFAAVFERAEVVIALACLLIVQAIENQPLAKLTVTYTDDDKTEGGDHE